MSVEKVNTVTAIASTAVGGAISDIFTKLCSSFKLSDEAKQQSKKCQSEIGKLQFKRFHESSSCKSLKDIPINDFNAFVTERLQKRLNLPEKVTDSLLDGIYGGENQEKVNDFQFQDGQGNIHHGRFITLKRNDKIDLAYAIYTLSFELAEKETIQGSYEWWFSILPVWNETTKREVHHLNDSEKDMFSKWCQVKLYNSVAEECLKD